MKNILFLLVFAVSVANGQMKFQSISPSDPNIHYKGRIDRSDSDNYAFDWAGTTIECRFTGKSIAIRFKGGERNYFNLMINHSLHEIVHAKNDTVVWVKGLKGNGPHTFQLIKRTEGEMGKTNFYGLLIEPGKKILALENLPERRIEVIGNSITCGYGTEGKNSKERFKPETENVLKAYGAVLARAFNAETRFIAHSGLGVVRNYNDPSKISTKLATMPQRFDRAIEMDSMPKWDFSEWQPHVVIINLGANDFSTLPHPDKAVFLKHYELLITNIRDVYGKVPIFCVVNPSVREPGYNYVKEAVESYRSLYSDYAIHFVGLPSSLLNSTDDLGSDSHPSYKGQRKMAGQLLLPIATVLNWDYDASEIF